MALIKKSVKGTEIKDYLTPSTMGIIWITDAPMATKPYPYPAFDYLMDGVLSQKTFNFPDEKGQDKNVFITEHFGHPFVLGHVSFNSNSLDKELKGIVALISDKSRDKGNIIVAHAHPDKEFAKRLTKSFSKQKFEEIILT